MQNSASLHAGTRCPVVHLCNGKSDELNDFRRHRPVDRRIVNAISSVAREPQASRGRSSGSGLALPLAFPPDPLRIRQWHVSGTLVNTLFTAPYGGASAVAFPLFSRAFLRWAGSPHFPFHPAGGQLGPRDGHLSNSSPVNPDAMVLSSQMQIVHNRAARHTLGRTRRSCVEGRGVAAVWVGINREGCDIHFSFPGLFRWRWSVRRWWVWLRSGSGRRGCRCGRGGTFQSSI